MEASRSIVLCIAVSLAACGGVSNNSTEISNTNPLSADADVTNLFSLATFPVGVAVSAGNESRSFLGIVEKQSTISQHFSQITASNIMKMSYLHPSENIYTFTAADEMVDWAEAYGLSVHGHTLIWHSDYQVPRWMAEFDGDFEAMLDSHVSTVAEYFSSRVVSWDVLNEVIDEKQPDCYRQSIFYQKVGSVYISNAFRAAKSADENADLYLNDFGISEGGSAKHSCLLKIVDGLLADNIPIDGVGFQMHIQIDWPDSDAIRSAFQSIVDRGLKVKITELDVPVNNPYSDSEFPQFVEFTSSVAEIQKRRYKSVVETYMDTVPSYLRGGVSIWGLWDGDSWLLDLDQYQGVEDWPLLFAGPANGPYQKKPAFDGIAEAFSGD